MIAICIPAHAPRLDELRGCLDLLKHPSFRVLVVTNEPQPIHHYDLPDDVVLFNTGSAEVNLSKWWNVGLQWAHNQGLDTLMITESDVRMTPEAVWFMHGALWQKNYGMVGPNLYGNLAYDEISVETRQDGWGRRHAGHRICQTWMVKTGTTFPADPRFAWWHADEQHEMRHRAVGNGTAIIGAATYARPLYQSTDPSQSEELSKANKRARSLFRAEWGFEALV